MPYRVRNKIISQEFGELAAGEYVEMKEEDASCLGSMVEFKTPPKTKPGIAKVEVREVVRITPKKAARVIRNK